MEARCPFRMTSKATPRYTQTNVGPNMLVPRVCTVAGPAFPKHASTSSHRLSVCTTVASWWGTAKVLSTGCSALTGAVRGAAGELRAGC